MKTVKEKARAYDKVREKIAVRFGTNVVKEIFSEFEESEDEQIKKALIKYFSEGREYLSIIPYNKEECIAWLEKVQKPAKWDEEDENIFNRIIQKLDESDNVSHYDYADFEMWLIDLKERFGKIEQESSEWSEETVKEALLSEVLPCFMHGGEADEVVAKLDEVINKNKKQS